MKVEKTPLRILFVIINTVLLSGIAVLCLLPLWHVFMASLSDPSKLSKTSGIVIAPLGKITLRGYMLVLKNPGITTGYVNTLIYVVGMTVIGVSFTCIAAYVLSRKALKWKGLIMFVITFTALFNGGLIPFYLLIQSLGWMDNRLAVIIPGCLSVFNIIVMRTSFLEIPISLEESAKLDGAGHFTVLFRIIVPLSKAVIAVVVLFTAVGQWNSWFNAMLFIKRRELYPLQLILREILLQNDISKVLTSADAARQSDIYKQLVKYCTTIVATGPILLLYPHVQKYFIKGIMIGSLKG